MKKRRELSPQDRAIWHYVKQSIKPLRPTNEVPPEIVLQAAIPHIPQVVYQVPVIKTHKPLAPIERGLKQKLSRGRVDPEAKLDLHGLRQEDAYRRLAAFLEEAQFLGLKLVIIVTGKSGEAVLKRMVPMWLASANFRHLVIGYEEAGRYHGRDGALYVRVRRLI